MDILFTDEEKAKGLIKKVNLLLSAKLKIPKELIY